MYYHGDADFFRGPYSSGPQAGGEGVLLVTNRVRREGRHARREWPISFAILGRGTRIGKACLVSLWHRPLGTWCGPAVMSACLMTAITCRQVVVWDQDHKGCAFASSMSSRDCCEAVGQGESVSPCGRHWHGSGDSWRRFVNRKDRPLHSETECRLSVALSGLWSADAARGSVCQT